MRRAERFAGGGPLVCLGSGDKDGGSAAGHFAGGLRLGGHGVDLGPVSGAGQPGATVDGAGCSVSATHAAWKS